MLFSGLNVASVDMETTDVPVEEGDRRSNLAGGGGEILFASLG